MYLRFKTDLKLFESIVIFPSFITLQLLSINGMNELKLHEFSMNNVIKFQVFSVTIIITQTMIHETSQNTTLLIQW